MYYRRELILNLLDRFDGVLSAKRFQKLLFLFTRLQDDKSFDFVPFKYGCYSFQAGQDLHTMAKQALLDIEDTLDGNVIHLRAIPEEASGLTLMDSSILDKIHSDFHALSQDELIRYTYVKYPFYAI